MSRKTYIVTLTDPQRDAILWALKHEQDTYRVTDPVAKLLSRAHEALADAPQIVPGQVDALAYAVNLFAGDHPFIVGSGLIRVYNQARAAVDLLRQAIKGQR